MSAAIQDRPATRVTPSISFARVVRSELIKFQSLRSTWITYVVALVVGIGFGLLASGFGGAQAYQHNQPLDVVGVPLHGVVIFAQLALGVVGALFVTGEYATGSIRVSMTAVPKRVPVLVAKVTVLGVVTAVVALVMAFVAFIGGEGVLSATFHSSASLGSTGALRAVMGSALYVVCVALIGLGLGFAIRNTGGTIATLFGIVLVLPLLAQALPQSWQDHINKFLPLDIANHMLDTGINDTSVNQLPHAWGAVMLVVYALVALGIGLTVLKGRDV